MKRTRQFNTFWLKVYKFRLVSEKYVLYAIKKFSPIYGKLLKINRSVSGILIILYLVNNRIDFEPSKPEATTKMMWLCFAIQVYSSIEFNSSFSLQ
jgi:hypothetical protein